MNVKAIFGMKLLVSIIVDSVEMWTQDARGRNSARGDSSTGSELKAVEEACREASRTVEPCELRSTMLQNWRATRKPYD
jgi:hypothetical protein